MSQRVVRRPMTIALAIAVVSAALVLIAATNSFAAHDGGADTIVLTIDDGGPAVFDYGSHHQEIDYTSAKCNANDVTGDDVIEVSAETPGPMSYVGLVANGLGATDSPKGNAQSCGRVDHLGDDTTEALKFMLGADAAGEAIYWVSFDFEAKFDAEVQVDFLDGDGHVIVGSAVTFSLTDGGSDSGPDSKYNDKYRRLAVYPDGAQGVLISMIAGSVSVEGGADWPVPDDHRTVFGLTEPLACDDSISTEDGANYTDDPYASFYLGESSKGLPCGVPVSLTTETVAEVGHSTQLVTIEPPDGFSWAGLGVTGLVTVQWDAEAPTSGGVGRSYERIDGVDTVIPWCEDVVGIALDVDPFYALSPAGAVYDEAVPSGGNLCLVLQSTEVVDISGEVGDLPEGDTGIRTQTTEVFYLWNDPIISRY